jgi:hypothetical protein
MQRVRIISLEAT